MRVDVIEVWNVIERDRSDLQRQIETILREYESGGTA